LQRYKFIVIVLEKGSKGRVTEVRKFSCTHSQNLCHQGFYLFKYTLQLSFSALNPFLYRINKVRYTNQFCDSLRTYLSASHSHYKVNKVEYLYTMLILPYKLFFTTQLKGVRQQQYRQKLHTTKVLLQFTYLPLSKSLPL
jgi:hypothetical protein